MAAVSKKRSVADRISAEHSREALAPIESVSDLFAQRLDSPSIRRLMLAAVDTFSRNGFHGASTREIAKRAKLSPAAVYVHFRSKEDLLYSAVLIISNWVFDEVMAVKKEDLPPRERMRKMVEVHVTSHAKMRNALIVVEYEFGTLNPVQRKKILLLRDAMEEMFETCIREGCEQGVFKVTDIPATKVAVLSLCVSVLNWFSPKGRLSATDVGKLYAELVLSMINATPASR